MASLPVRPALKRNEKSSIQFTSFKKASFEIFHLTAAEGKKAPLVIGCKVGSAVETPRHRQVITVFVIVVDTGQIRELSLFRRSGRSRVGLLVQHCVHVVPCDIVIHITGPLQGEGIGFENIGCKTAQQIEMMPVLRIELICERGLA